MKPTANFKNMPQSAKSPSLWFFLGAIAWMLWIFVDYWFKHPLYSSALSNTFFAIPVIHLILGVMFYFLIFKFQRRAFSAPVLLGMFLLFLWLGTLVNLMMYSTVDYSASSVIFFLLRTLAYVLFVGGLVFSAYQLGRLILLRVCGYKAELAASVYTAVGLSFFMLLIFILLVAGVYASWSLAVLFLIPLLINYNSAFKDLKSIVLLKPDLKLTAIGVVSLLLIILMDAITFGYTLSPFPVGFDALNYYINLPKLMAEAGELLPGFQPYNWSLLQAAGVTLMGKVELALILSWLGLLLVQWATFEVGRHILKLSVESSLLGVLLFTFMPCVTTQASQELKVDLGLTFVLLTMVLATFTLLKQIKTDQASRRSTIVLAVLIGLLGGVALGIKLTAVIALFALVSILWYVKVGKLAFIGVFFICLSIVFLAQMDSKAGLRAYHASVAWLQYVSLGVGIICLMWSIRGKVKHALHAILLTAAMGATSAVVFSPWVAKNLSEIKNPSFMEMINGTSHGPNFNARTIDRNLKKKRNQSKNK